MSQAPSGAEGDSSNVPDVAGPSGSAAEAATANNEGNMGSDDDDADREADSSEAITSGLICIVEQLMNKDRESAAGRQRLPPRVGPIPLVRSRPTRCTFLKFMAGTAKPISSNVEKAGREIVTDFYSSMDSVSASGWISIAVQDNALGSASFRVRMLLGVTEGPSNRLLRAICMSLLKDVTPAGLLLPMLWRQTGKY